MELRYCEMCGEIIKLQGEEETLGQGTHVCERCSTKQQAAPQPVKKRAEDIAFRRETSAQENAAAAGSVANEISLENLLANKQLDLYSADTLARRKTAQTQKEQEKARTATKIKLLDPDMPVPQAPLPQELAAAQDTARITTLEAPPAEAGYLAENPTESDDATSRTAKMTPVAPPAHVRFPCAHCGVTLEIAPIVKPSRLRCPRCKTAMSISPDGNVKILEGGSSAVRVVGSSVTRKKTPPPPQTLMSAPLVDKNPTAPAEPATFTAPPPVEDPAPKAAQPHAAHPKFDYTGALIEDFTEHIAPATMSPAAARAHHAPDHEERPLLAHEQATAISQLLKAFVLGLALAAPLYLWSILVLLNKSQTVDVWLQTYGQIVKQVFDKLLGAN